MVTPAGTGPDPGVGDVLEQGVRQGLPVSPLLSPAQGSRQGPGADRLQAQVAQDAGDLGLAGGRLDHTSQNHLLKGPVIPDRLTQPQAGAGAVQDFPQQGRVRRVHRGTGQTSASRCRLSGTPGPAAPGPARWRSSPRPASSRTSSSASSWAEPRCSTIRRTPPDLDAICTTVAPDAVLTLRTKGFTPARHTGF